MNPFSHTGLSISDSLKSVRKSVLIYETIIDLTNLQNQFMAVLQEIKKEIGVEKGKPLTKEVVQQMYSETMKGQDALHPSVSPEQVVDLILSSISGMELADQDSLAEVRQALLHLMQQMAKQDHEIKNE